ncbi:MAG: RNA polymerase factor sigma-54 [Candidatus Omnitrophica bacterium]|nr:RNA polymerase factor sigma-54 [Candidatus Omnitrophota bacterium]
MKLAQRLVLTPNMRQALHILQLPLLELKKYLQEKVVENPLLEESNEEQEKEQTQTDELLDNLLQNQTEAPEYFDSDNDNTSYGQEQQKKQAYKESLLRYSPSLQEHLIQQLNLSSGLTPAQYQIGQLIIGNVDENGYLDATLEELRETSLAGKAEIKKVLSLIQTFDPPGVGSSSLKECLLIQLKQQNKEHSLSAKILQRYLTDLEKRKYEHLAQLFKVAPNKIEEAVKEIASLEPKPGRPFASFPNSYINPDLFIQKQKGQYEIILNDEELPALQISSRYRKLLEDKKVPKNTKHYLKQQLHSAVWLIKAVAQRQATLLNLVQFLIKEQKEFLEKGTRYLKPLTVEKIARAIKRDKSTVSRVIANKYIQTPSGIIALRDFLSQGVKVKPGKFISSKNIKVQIEELIKNEDIQHPLTDEKIVEILKERQIHLARRTAAKYREQLKILPANLRKNSFHKE